MKLEKTDLTGITRNPDKVRCTIHVDPLGEQSIEWIVAGEVCIRDEGRICNIHARMDCTDSEHDSAYAFSLPLIGLKFRWMSNNTSVFEAWVNPQAGEPFPDFHVPRPGYDPRKLDKTETCTQCEKPHQIIPEGYYVPPFDRDLYKLVRGVKVDIRIGPNWRELCPELYE